MKPFTIKINWDYRIIALEDYYAFQERGMFLWWRWKTLVKWTVENGKAIVIK